MFYKVLYLLYCHLFFSVFLNFSESIYFLLTYWICVADLLIGKLHLRHELRRHHFAHLDQRRVEPVEHPIAGRTYHRLVLTVNI